MANSRAQNTTEKAKNVSRNSKTMPMTITMNLMMRLMNDHACYRFKL